MKKCIITIFTISFIYGYGFGQISIDFSAYLSEMQNIEQHKQNIEPSQLDKAYHTNKNKECNYEDLGDHISIDPLCLYHKDLPILDFKEAIDLIREYVEGFPQTYQTQATEVFDYEGTQPIYTNLNIKTLYTLKNSSSHKSSATYHSILGNKIKIPKYIIAQLQTQNYNFYAVHSDKSVRRGCTLHNYETSLYSMDKLFLYPGQVFNFNKHISHLNYCKGTGPQHLRFYGGVCGSASQLFRLSLLIPNIEITQRHGHSERRSVYYGDDITGDDAAVYEMYKQFEIKNNDNRGIYIRTIKGEKHDYLVGISPYKINQGVRITREQENRLRTNLHKEIYNINDRELTFTAQSFPTRYIRQNYIGN